MRALVTHKPGRALFCLLAVSLIAAACSGGAEEASREPASAPSDLSLNSSEGASLDNVPAEVVNSWGVTSFNGYLDIDPRATTDQPYGPLTGGLTVSQLPLSELVRGSQAIVVGTVTDISPAHYNSVDGGFWYEPSTEAGRMILQDITIEVERVLGDTAGIAAGNEKIVGTIIGGQIEVSFGPSVDPALLPEGWEPGQTFVESMAPYIRVSEGDRGIFFLSSGMRSWFGAPVDSDMPWGKTTVAGCPAVPLGTAVWLYLARWQLLGAEGQRATFEERTVTVDELATLADENIGQALKNPGAPARPDDGRQFDDPPQPCNDPGRHPTQSDVPPHTHPDFNE